MEKKIIGQVSEEEKKAIQSLFKRKNGLNELAKIYQLIRKTYMRN